MYRFSGGYASFDADTGVFMISVASISNSGTGLVMPAHELKHAYQFETGNYSILNTNVKNGFYDCQDEAEAYARGAL